MVALLRDGGSVLVVLLLWLKPGCGVSIAAVQEISAAITLLMAGLARGKQPFIVTEPSDRLVLLAVCGHAVDVYWSNAHACLQDKERIDLIVRQPYGALTWGAP